MEQFESYLDALRQTPIDNKTEHTDRAALETLLNALRDAHAPNARVQHEPPRAGDKGSPDFKVMQSGMVLGYVEVKPIGENLDRVRRSAQVAKYQALSGNIVLTDYLQFVWLRNGEVAARAQLVWEDDVRPGSRGGPSPEKAQEVENLLRGFLSIAPEGIGRAEDLALALAARCRLLRDGLASELGRQVTAKRGKLFGLYEVFRTKVFADLKPGEFADAFAQMLGYGLFLSKYNADGREVTLHNVEQFVPRTFELIRELVDFLDVLNEPAYTDVRWVVEEIVSLVNGLDLAALSDDLSFDHRRGRRGYRAKNEDEARLFERDPYVYFYETFLEKYDQDTREGRGVYYTPPPVVNFIVRAVDDVLERSLSIRDGLADRERVTVLDFATGTGTFMLEVFQRVLERVGEGKAEPYVGEHLTRNVYGFEYLIAPYTIAHLKLSQFLAEKVRPLADGERLKVYLTNTLEPIDPQYDAMLPKLSDEVEAAQEVKEKPILAIVGNPPYSGHSRNRGAWITNLIADYTAEFPELRKPGQGKWLQDDYVKFIRFAQWKMDQVDEGVVGIVTNHSFLDNPTFRGLRKSLMETFDQIHVLDLHGNAKKKEVAPDGSDDVNVFDIQQGVAISLLVKKAGLERGVWHADLWGSRLSKYEALARGTMDAIEWTKLTPGEPSYFFMPFDRANWLQYDQGWALPDIFAPGGDPAPGIVTTHDQFAVSFTEDEAIDKVERLLASPDEDAARRLFRLCSTNQWSYDDAKEELPGSGWQEKLTAVQYRPFDVRWTVWDSNVAVHRRTRVSAHMRRSNLSVCTPRQVKSESSWFHTLASDAPVESTFISNRTSEIGYTFPLYLYAPDVQPEPDGLFAPDDPFQGRPRIENFAPDFRAFLDATYADQPSLPGYAPPPPVPLDDGTVPKREGRSLTPEEVMGYLYAVLHAPTYRDAFAGFLRVDFPRVPFPADRADLERLSALGWDLMQRHLLRDVPDRGLGSFHGRGDRRVDRRKLVDVEGEHRLHINADQYFAPVPPAVHEFRIGGYQVLDKYLKDRKDRTLSLDEIEAIERIVNVLDLTIERMGEIDEAYQATVMLVPEDEGEERDAA